MAIERMVGIPWHVEKMVRQEGDARRHKSRCIFYRKSDSYCPKVVGKCRGAAHCNYYEEHNQMEAAICYQECEVDEFKGVKMIFMSDIKVKKHFHLPSKEKIDTVFEYYKEHGELDKPIVVSCHGNWYYLEDKYLRYYVAQQLGLKKIPAKIGDYKEVKLENRIRKLGTKVTHTKYGEGKVVDVSDKNITILFEAGNEVSFNIEMCIKKKFIELN